MEIKILPTGVMAHCTDLNILCVKVNVFVSDSIPYLFSCQLVSLQPPRSISYGGSEVTCRKPDTFLLVATFAASFTASLILLRV